MTGPETYQHILQCQQTDLVPHRLHKPWLLEYHHLQMLCSGPIDIAQTKDQLSEKEGIKPYALE